MTPRKRYTEEELIVIRSEIGYRAPRLIARQLGRTADAVASKAHKMGLSPEVIARRAQGMSRMDVCTCLGIDTKTMYRLVRERHLHPHKYETARRKGTERYVYSFDPYDVEEFLRARGALLTMHPTDDVWTAIYQEARADLERRYIGFPELQCVLFLSRNFLNDRKYGWSKQGFPAPAFRFQANYYECTAVLAWLSSHKPHYLTKAARERLGGTDQ